MCASTSTTRTVGATLARSVSKSDAIGLGIVERLPGRVDHADAAERQDERHRRGRAIELRRQAPRDLAALVGGGAHQRHRRRVAIEGAAGERRRHGVHAVEVHHVEGAGRHDLRDRAPGGGAVAIGAGAQDAADHLVAPLGGGDVEDALDEAAVDERLHRPAAGAGGVEDQDVVAGGFELLPRRRHARRRHPEHRRGEQRPRRIVALDRAPDRPCRRWRRRRWRGSGATAG